MDFRAFECRIWQLSALEEVLAFSVPVINTLQIQAAYLHGQRYTGQETSATQLLLKSLNAKWRTLLG